MAKFLSTGTPTHSTYLGGAGDDRVQAMAVDQLHRPHVVGWTNSTDFPLRNPIQGSPAGALDGFAFVLNASGSGAVHSTYIGGSVNDYARGVAVDGNHNTYVAGYTYSTNFPTLNALQPSNAGERDLFLTKIDNSSLDFFIAAVPAESRSIAGQPSDR